MSDIIAMNGRELIRRLRRLARKNNVDFSVDPVRGKGSHRRVTYNGRKSTIPYHNRDIPTGTIAAICRQLGVDRDDL